MQKNLYLLIFLFFIFLNSCTDKKIQLAQIEIEGISKIYNHSSIWIFYEIKDNDTLAILNKNNKILNTHWIFNIDKRLSMKKIVPFLQEMQKNKNKDSMHKKEGMLNYFSYADNLTNKISLIIFNPTKYIDSKKKYQALLKNNTDNKIIELDIKNEVILLDGDKIEAKQLTQKLKNIELKYKSKSIQLILKYNANLNYQNYLYIKALLNNSEIKIDATEYIYSLK